MSAVDLLSTLTSAGVVLSRRGDMLHVVDTRHAVTPELRRALVEQKPALLAMLTSDTEPTSDTSQSAAPCSPAIAPDVRALLDARYKAIAAMSHELHAAAASAPGTLPHTTHEERARRHERQSMTLRGRILAAAGIEPTPAPALVGLVGLVGAPGDTRGMPTSADRAQSAPETSSGALAGARGVLLRWAERQNYPRLALATGEGAGTHRAPFLHVPAGHTSWERFTRGAGSEHIRHALAAAGISTGAGHGPQTGQASATQGAGTPQDTARGTSQRGNARKPGKTSDTGEHTTKRPLPGSGAPEGPATRWHAQNYTHRVTAYVDVATGRGVLDSGAHLTCPPAASLGALLDALPPDVRRVYLCGDRPGSGGSAGMYAWALDAAVTATWDTDTRGHYLEPDAPVLRFRHRLTGQRVELRRMAVWLGEGQYTPEEARAAMHLLAGRISRAWDGGTILATPAATGLDVWQRGIPLTASIQNVNRMQSDTPAGAQAAVTPVTPVTHSGAHIGDTDRVQGTGYEPEEYDI